MNVESILNQFSIVEKSVYRAKLPFEVDTLHPEVMKVTAYECLKSIHQLKNILSELGYTEEAINGLETAYGKIET